MQCEKVITFKGTRNEIFKALLLVRETKPELRFGNQQVCRANYVRLKSWHQNWDLS